MDDAVLVTGGPGEEQTIALSERVVVIGSAAMNDIVVDYPRVSRRHATIRRDYRGYWLTDLGSRRGTFVNGTRLGDEPHKLHDDDRVEFGEAGSSVHWVFVHAPSTGQGDEPEVAQRGEPAKAAYAIHRDGLRATTDRPEPSRSQPRPLFPIPRNVLLALFGALLGGEAVIIALVLVLLLRTP